MSMKKILTIILCIFPTLLLGQNIDVSKYFAHTFDNSFVKSKYGKFKGQFLKGKCNGMGVLQMKDNSLYVGDFMDGEITGYGMKIATSGKQVLSNCPGAMIYIGNWNKGQKSGIGTCYDNEGKIVYHGNFLADKPTATYPAQYSQADKHVSIIELSDGGAFIGETNQGIPNGLGFVLMENGDLCQSAYKNGERCGIGLYLMSDGNWETLSFENGKSYTITSSDNYNQIDSQRKQMVREAWAKAGRELAGLSTQLVESVNNIHAIASGKSVSSYSASLSSNTTSDVSVSTGNNSSKTSNTKEKSQMSMSDQVNYNSLRNTYNKWASDLMEMKNANGKYQNGFKASDKKYAQDEMKRIRKSAMQKWNKEIPYNSIEDW